jgi:hypothetical protein
MTTLMKRRLIALAGLASACALASPSLAGPQATLSRSVEVAGSPDAVWARIGAFCAIGDWHPAIGSCRLDAHRQPTRTLMTRDGAKFVELQVARNAAAHSYSYAFVSSPVPVTHYVSTFSVGPAANGRSVVTWSSRYTPDPGKEVAARDALTGIYESGLAAIQGKAAARP